METIAEKREAPNAGLISPDELYRRYNGAIGRGSIYEAIKANKIKHLKIGRRILVLESEVVDWPLREAEAVK